ncbi:hypothetical protein EVA_08032 [gut metagenome]|uniref:Uncharacterized protein n=1 Tax=gut metagenome TaxID=749906 RepID=J9GAJ4_9ZZZZ
MVKAILNGPLISLPVLVKIPIATRLLLAVSSLPC